MSNRATPLLLALFCCVVACQSTGAKRPPYLGARREQRGISDAKVRADVADLLRLWEGRVAHAADRIHRESDDPDVRRYAIRWKILGIPAAQAAALRDDPSVGLADIWAFTLQMEHHFRDGAGSDLFGHLQPVALDACAGILVALDALEPDLHGDDPAQLRKRLEEWAANNPIGAEGFDRRSTAGIAAAIAGDRKLSVTESVRSMEERVADLTHRLSIYTELLPRQARWQADLLTEEVLQRKDMRGALRDLAVTASSLERLAELEEVLKRELDEMISEIEAERAIVLRDIDRQRLATLESVASEREAILADVDRQRGAAQDAISKEREAVVDAAQKMLDSALASVEGAKTDMINVIDQQRRQVIDDTERIAAKTLSESVQGARGLIDHFFWRAVQAGGALLAMAVVGALLYRRLTR
ncbi:MAG: hypothetical protein ACYTGZ_11395 [Planctomycetota bacterium]|jgi:hypothetical protein